MIDYDAEPFPEIDPDYEAFISAHSGSETSSDTDDELDGTNGSRASEKVNHKSTTDSYARIPSDELSSEPRGSGFDEVIVQRSDTQVIIHWNAQTGQVNYENGPPIDHPRLLALLCDARIDLQHCDPTGSQPGLLRPLIMQAGDRTGILPSETDRAEYLNAKVLGKPKHITFSRIGLTGSRRFST